jgi:hypothetical protein
MEGQALYELSTDRLEQFLIRSETAIGQVRAAQLTVLAEMDRRQVAMADGCRTLAEWVAGRMDVAPETAATLVQTLRCVEANAPLTDELGNGRATFDRVTAVARSGDDDLARHLDIAAVRRRNAARRSLSRLDERRRFADRYLTIQPALDEVHWRLHGQLPSVAGRVVEMALHARGDTFDDLPDGIRLSRGQRNADALVAMAEDSLDREGDHQGTVSGSTVTLFVDATEHPQGGETGGEVAYGPRVGPDALEAVLCTGSVRVIGLVGGRPVAASTAARAVPPAVRRFVAWRDGGCTADGCTSRYRLEVHHIRWRADGGGQDPTNLTTLCWFHHHVVIHGQGFRIDPDSSPGRRRFLRPRSPDPP